MSDLAPDPEAILLESNRTSPEPDQAKPRTLAGDALYDLRHNRIFWLSAVMMVFVAALVLFPDFIADAEKTSSLSGGCDLSNSLLPPSKEYWFGTDQQGCDVFSLSVYGARPSVMVGVFGALGVALIGAVCRAHRRLLRWSD